MALHDVVLKSELPVASQAPRLATLSDHDRSLWSVGPEGKFEQVGGNVSAWCVGDDATTTFTIGDIPANCIVDKVEVVVSGTAGTAATTVAVGISGTTGKYMAASSFTSSMDTAGVKTVTTVKAHETSARTVIATFSAAWDEGAKALIAVHYIKIPAVPS